MKLNIQTKCFLCSTLLVIFGYLHGCSSSQEEGEMENSGNDENSGDQNSGDNSSNDSGNAKAENNAAGENSNTADAKKGDSDGAAEASANLGTDVDSQVAGDGAQSLNAAAPGESSNAAEINSALTDATGTDVASANPAKGKNSAATPAAQSAPEEPAAAAPVASSGPSKTLPERGQVKYVRGNLSKRSGPGGQVVGSFEKGDHPLVIKESDWAELSNGTFVESTALSEDAVPRNHAKANWH